MSAPPSPPSPTGLASPRLLRAVEPTLSLHLDSEDDEPAIGSRSSARSAVAALTSTGSVPLDEEEITLLPPAATPATGSSGTTAVDPSPVAVDEPASDDDNDDGPASSSSRASAASAASRNGAPSTFSSSAAAGPPEPQAHYASHLWFGVDAVLAQAEAARASTKALGSFLREKAALDRSYGADLRKLTARWAAQADLPARASPAQSGTVVAGLVALRGLALQTASAIELQAERLDEEATDPFLDEAAEAMSAARAAEQKARAQCKALEAAMDNLAAHKAALQRACADLARTSGSSPAPNKPSSSSGDSSWMSDLVGFTPFRSSGADLSRKVPGLDAKYTAAIRRAREARGEFDVAIGATLAELERAEARRLRATREVGLRFAQTLHSTAAGAVKSASAAVAALGAVRPRRDLELFISDTVKRTGGRKDPPPLPVYRLFKGHPNYSSGGTPTGSASARSSRRGSAQQLLQQQSQSSSSRSSTQRRGAGVAAEDPATDSDADAAESDAEEEEIELSEATDSDNEDGEEAGAKSSDSDSDDAEAETPAGSLSPTSAAQLNSAEQAAAESTFAALLDALKEGEHADADAALTIQVQMDAAAALLDRPAGRAALASALKRAVAAAAAAPPAQPSNHDLALAVEPIMPVSPSKALGSAALEEEDAEALTTTGGSIFSSTPSASSASASAPAAVLLLCPDSFDRLATLLLRLLDACQLAMHAQPAMSVLRASRRIARADAESSSAGASFFSSSSVAAPAQAELMLSRLSSHDACSSVRLWELAYFESLARAQARRPSHRWHTAAEQRAHAAAQVDVAHKLLRRYANEMVSTPAMSDAQVIAFVDKFAHMQQMTPAHVADLLTLECFARQGVRAMPSDANAGKRRPLVASSAAVSGAASGPKGTPGKPAKKSGHKVPVAMPVAAPAPAPAPAPTPSSASLFSPASASSSSSTPSSRTSSSSKARAGRSILQSARPPFDTALEVEVLGDMTDDMNDVGL